MVIFAIEYQTQIQQNIIYFYLQLLTQEQTQSQIKNSKNDMSAVKDSRVEFFNSQSSFGSSSVVSSSRLQFINDQVFNDSEEIFISLRNFLIPREDLLDKEKLNQIIHRAKIMTKSTIRDHMRHIPQNLRTPEHTKTMEKCLERLQTLIRDFQNYQQRSMEYSSFYQLYGNPPAKNFLKALPNNGQIVYLPVQPDIVNINIIQQPKYKHLKNSGREIKVFGMQKQKNSNQKQIQELQQEVILLKKKLKVIVQEYEDSEAQLKTETDERVRRILKIHQEQNQKQSVKILKQQLVLIQTKLQEQYFMNNHFKTTIQQLQKNIQQLKYQNKILKEQIQSNRRISDSRISHQSKNNKSIYSQFDGVNENQNNKLQKTVKNLKYQNSILKNQLQKERQTLYKLKKQQNNQLSDEVIRLKSRLETNNKQLNNTRMELDRYKIETIKLTDQLQKSIKSTQLVKLEATKFQTNPGQNFSLSSRTQDIKDMSISTPALNYNMLSPHHTSPKLEQSRSVGNKPIVSPYLGDGNQYSPYYELLTKEFKARFKRSCMKEKELLQKSNGLEIGVITEYFIPNQIKVYLHLANIGEKQIKRLKLRLTNSKNNKINLDKHHFQVLEIGQQVKSNIHATLRYYPVGCTALLCEYEYNNQNHQVRILLPVHIFKCLKIQPKDDQFRNPKSIKVQPQKKIIKDLASYFKGGKIQGDRICCAIIHQHTETKFLTDIINKAGMELQIIYEHRSGDEAITEYCIKALKFLLEKDHTS